MRAQARLFTAIGAAALVGVFPVAAAEFKGKVELLEKGRPSADKTLAVDATVVVFEPARAVPAPKPVVVDMTTVRKEFSPRILVVPVGSTVRFPNLDPILHNVFSVSGRNSFDLGLLGKGAGKSAIFREAGIVRVFCNVHHAMFGYVFVVASPYWARVDSTGRFSIPGVPAGGGKLTIWNERSSPTTREMTVPVAGPLTLGVDITMPRIPPHKNKLGKPYGGGAMAERRRGLSLGTRIFLVTGLLLVLALGVAIVVTSYLGNRIGLATATERILSGNSVQTASQQQRYQQLQLQTQILTADPELKAYLLRAIDEHDQLSLLDQLDERQTDLGYDFALMVDPQGRLLVRTDQPDAPAVDLSARPLVKKVLVDFEASGIWQEGSKIYESVAVPLTLSQNVFAYLVVGFAINDVRALEVKRITGTEMAYLTSTATGVAVVASTLAPAQQDRLLSALRTRGDLLARVTERGQAIDQVEIQLEGARWLALLAPLKDAAGAPAGASVSLASLDKELAGYTRIRNLLVLIGLATLAAALLVSYLLSRRVFKPVRQLVDAATAARSGNYEAPMPTGGPGEVADLASAFNTLLIDLRERRDMAAYVSALSRNLPEPVARGEAPSQPERARLTLMGVDLRRFASPRQNADAESLMQRLSRDLKRVLNTVEANGGYLEAVFGHRAIASFAGAMQADRALAAAAEILAAVAARDGVFDEAQPPAIAISAGEVVTGAVNFTDTPERTVIGLPLQQVEGLLREANPGDILLAPAVHAEIAPGLAQSGIELEPQRGLLSTQAIFILAGEDAARIAGRASAQAAAASTAATAAGGSRGGSFDTLSDLGPGTLLGSRFEILSTLGAGGMGVVFKARDRELDDLVALKMLKREVAGDGALVERLKSELKLARKITHPNILRTFDFGEIDGNPFISMEYVRGLTLRAMLERSGRLPYSAGLRLARQLTSGLAAAHALSIIHRDIKPENIILDSQGNAKLMDFGLARPVTRLTAGQTQAGFIVGTPHYLAPEQLEGKEPDQRADVYACGVVLFEVFTGRLPFGGTNAMEIILQHLKQPPVPPHEYWPEIPPALERLLLRCLEKAPAERYADAAALEAELDKLTA